ncbi:MAG: hypothetical protein IJ903_02830 [Ruminococcus sp.]|nr:hypothetical protein [Ruminococcus sp.]
MYQLAKSVKDVNGLVKEFQKLFSPKHFMDLIYCGVFIAVALLLTKIVIQLLKKYSQKKEIDPSLTKFFVRVIWTISIVIIIMKFLSLLNFSGAGLIAAFSAAAGD